MLFKRTDGWEMRFEVGVCIHLWMTPRKMIWQDLTFWLHGQEMDGTGGLSNLAGEFNVAKRAKQCAA